MTSLTSLSLIFICQHRRGMKKYGEGQAIAVSG